MSDFFIYGARWNATDLPGMRGFAIQTGRKVRASASSGAPHRRLAAVEEYDQRIGLKSRALKSILVKMGMTNVYSTDNVPAASLAASGSLILGAAKLDPILPKVVSGSNHELLTIAAGLVCLKKLSWSAPGGGVEMDIMAYPVSADGQASGWVPSLGALPTLPAAEEEYDLHAATLNGAALSGMTGLEQRFDSNPQPYKNPGGIYSEIIRQAPATGPFDIGANFTLPDRNLLRTYGADFLSSALVDLVTTWRPFKQAAARDSTATNEIVISMTGVAHIANATDDRPGAVQVSFEAISADGVTSPVKWKLSA